VIRIVLANGFDNVALGLDVDLGDEIVLTFSLHIEAMQAIHAADDDFSGSASCADSNIEQWLHENLEAGFGKERRGAKAPRRMVEYQHTSDEVILEITESCESKFRHRTHHQLVARSVSTHMSIRIVLVEPQHPGNIGAVARAMKNMGLRELRL